MCGKKSGTKGAALLHTIFILLIYLEVLLNNTHMDIFSIIAIVLSIVALTKIGTLSGRVDALSEKLNKGALPSHKPLSLENVKETILDGDGGVDVKDTNTFVSKEEYVTKESAFVAWLKEDWLLKLGGTLVLMGVLFFLSVAYTAVGPQGKISIGYVFGVSLMLFGFRYAKKQIIGGSTIHVIGAVVIMITTYLTRQPEYDLFDPYFAMLLMFLTTVAVALTSYIHERPQLAHVGLFLTGFVPVLTNTAGDNFTEILVYLLIVTLGILWLALITKWRTLVLLALGIVCMYSVMKLTGGMMSYDITFTEGYLLLIFGILFYITSLFSILRGKGVTHPADSLVALGNAGFALMWVMSQVSSEMAPIVIASIGLVYALGFFFVYKVTDVYTSFVVYGSVSFGLLTTAIMLHLTGRAETVALLLIGAGVTVFTHYLSKDESITKVVAFVNIVPILYVLKSIAMITFSSYGYGVSGDVWTDVAIAVLAISVYFGLYAYFDSRVKELWQVSLFVGFMLSTITLWQVLHLILSEGVATFLSILVYTMVGLFVLFHGTQEKNTTKIKLAKMWMGAIAVRVVFWDAWQVDNVALSVLICIVIGILLLSSTFIIKKVTEE